MDYKEIKIIRPNVEDENSIQVLEEDLLDISVLGTEEGIILYPKEYGELKKHAFFLNKKFNWVIVKDASKDLCLVPLKKRPGVK